MKKFTYRQLKLMLSVYYFKRNLIGDKNIKDIADKISNFLGEEFSINDVLLCLTKIKSIDPSYKSSSQIDKNSDEWKLWQYYIVDDRKSELKKIYKELLEYQKNIIPLTAKDTVDLKIKVMKFTFIKDKKKNLYESRSTRQAESSARDPQVIYNALKLANFKCEYNKNHVSFIRKNTNNIQYTEGHHLIPLKFQNRFKYNLDVEANVVSLCSNCHNQLHYGKNVDDILKSLFALRKNRLAMCGIDLTIDELLEMYK